MPLEPLPVGGPWWWMHREVLLSSRAVGGRAAHLREYTSSPRGVCLLFAFSWDHLPGDKPLPTPKVLWGYRIHFFFFFFKELSMEDTSGNRFTKSNGKRDRNHNSKHNNYRTAEDTTTTLSQWLPLSWPDSLIPQPQGPCSGWLRPLPWGHQACTQMVPWALPTILFLHASTMEL